MNAVFQGFSIGSNSWLSLWSNDNLTAYNSSYSKSQQDMYLGVYGGLGLGQGMFLKVYINTSQYSISLFIEIGCTSLFIELNSYKERLYKVSLLSRSTLL